MKTNEGIRKPVHRVLQDLLNKNESPESMRSRCELLESIQEGETILSFGSGNGANLFCFKDNSIKKYYGVDMNELLHDSLRTKADALGLEFDIEQFVDIESIEDNSIDSILTTHVMCSVKDMNGVLEEFDRVLKTGGKYYFLEHVKAETFSWRWFLQIVVEPFWCVFDNCHFNDVLAQLEEFFEKKGWKTISLENKILGHKLLVADPHVIGIVEKTK